MQQQVLGRRWVPQPGPPGHCTALGQPSCGPESLREATPHIQKVDADVCRFTTAAANLHSRHQARLPATLAPVHVFHTTTTDNALPCCITRAPCAVTGSLQQPAALLHVLANSAGAAVEMELMDPAATLRLQ